MINRNARKAAPAWKTGVSATLIASLILACPGPGLYSAFAQGSGRTRLGGTPGNDGAAVKLIRSAVGDVSRPDEAELGGIEDAALKDSLAETGLRPALQLDGNLHETLQAPGQTTLPRQTGGKGATTADALRFDATMGAKTPGTDAGRVTYDGGLNEAHPAGEVLLNETATREPGLQHAAAAAPSVPLIERGERAFHAHEHEASPAGWKTWAFRGGLIAAAGAALVMGKISMGIAPLALLSAGVIGSIIAHELGHMVALKVLGDDTAKKHGHDSLNPLRHVDFWNTIVTPIATLTASMGFLHLPFVAGAAKPIPADFNSMHDDRRDPFWVALAGPAANIALAGVSFAAAWALPALGVLAAGGTGTWVLTQLAWTNIGLAAFNLLVPLPGFDGGKVWARFLPKKWYDRFTHNPSLPASYQDIHRRLYVGPAYPLHLLSQLGFRTQPQVNRVVWGLNIAVAGTVFLASFLWIGAPVVYMLLACAYDYYCIREKIQNEDAVNDLIDILQDFTSELAKAAEQDDSIQSVINQEEVEHVMKNVLEDIIDKVVDSEGFEQLSDDQRWERFTGVYTDEAVKALKEKGMTEDTPETIRRVLTQTNYGQRFFSRLREEFINRYEVWKKWHSPKRKASGAPEFNQKEKLKSKNSGGATMLSIAAIGILGASLLGFGFHDVGSTVAMIGAGAVLGTVQDASEVEVPKVKTFEEALHNPDLKLEKGEKAFLMMHLKEMKLEEKPPISGRIKEMMKLYKNITAPRGDINSVVLIGDAGVGKTAIPEKLAQAVALSEMQPDGDTFKLTKMNGRYLLKLSLGKLLKDKDPSPVQKLDVLIQLLQRFNDASKKSGNKVILFVDEVHAIFEHPEGPLMANLLKEVLRDGELTLITATTRKEYKKYMESDDAFRRRLIPIWVDESTEAETMRALQGAKSYYEDLYDVKIHTEALKAAAEMSKYDQEVFLPGRAFKYLLLAAKEGSFDSQRDRVSMAIQDKIEELRYVMKQLQDDLSTTELATENLKKDKPSAIELYNWSVELSKEITALYRKRAAIPTSGTPVVTAEMVKEQISTETGISAGQLTLGQEDMSKFIDMEANLNNIVVGQKEAIHTISQAVRENKAGLSPNEGPLGVFYLTGPTGSGKTYLAKSLAKYLSMNLIRLDMSEYQHDHEVAKMQGAPPGYVGFDAGGQLTEKVRRNPYSVLLFDEIEKAHPAVFMMLLQIMDEGRLTDGQGRLVDFKNTIILMSSNLGMAHLNDMLGKYVAEYKALKAELQEAGADTTKRLAIEAKMTALAERMARETKGPAKQITEEAFSKGYPPEFQARFTAPPIVFNRIDPSMAPDIVELELKKLRATLEYAGNELTWDPSVKKALAIEGFDIVLGARPLNNTIRRMVVQPIADAVLQAAKKNGNKITPSKISLHATNDGNIQIRIEGLPPKKVSKTDAGEGAEQDVFSKVLAGVVQAVSNHTNPEFSLREIDGWVKAAIAAHPVEAAPVAPTAQTPASATTQEPVTITVAPAPVAPTPKTAALVANVSLALGENAQKFVAETYKPKKDSGVIHTGKQLAEALAAAGYPKEVMDALLRPAGDKDNPLVGALKLFVEQAKLMGQEDQSKPVQLAFEVDENHVRLLVHRNGAVSEKEAAMWRVHFTGQPLDPTQARDKAEMLNVMGKDGRRVYFELYRALSTIPGTRIGWATGAKAQGGAGTDYWVEIPKPAEIPPAPPEEPKGPEETATNSSPDSAQLASTLLAKIHVDSHFNESTVEVEFASGADRLGIMSRSGLLETAQLPGQANVYRGRDISEVGAGRIAAAIAAQPGVDTVRVAPTARPYAEVALLPADPRAAKVGKNTGISATAIRIILTPESLQSQEFKTFFINVTGRDIPTEPEASFALNSADEAVEQALALMARPEVVTVELHPESRLRLLHRLRASAQAPPGPQTASAAESPLLSNPHPARTESPAGTAVAGSSGASDPRPSGDLRAVSADEWRTLSGFIQTGVEDSGFNENRLRIQVYVDPQNLHRFEEIAARHGLILNVAGTGPLPGRPYAFRAPNLASAADAVVEFAALRSLLRRNIVVHENVKDLLRDRAASASEGQSEPQNIIVRIFERDHEIAVHFRHALTPEQAQFVLDRAGVSFTSWSGVGGWVRWGFVGYQDAASAARIARTLADHQDVFRVDVPQDVLDLIGGASSTPAAEAPNVRLTHFASLPENLHHIGINYRNSAQRQIRDALNARGFTVHQPESGGLITAVLEPNDSTSVAERVAAAVAELVERGLIVAAQVHQEVLNLLENRRVSPSTPSIPQELLSKLASIGPGEDHVRDAIVEAGWGGPRRVSVKLNQQGLPGNDPLWQLGTGRGINGELFTVGARDAAHAVEIASQLARDPRVLRVGVDERTHDLIDERLAAASEASSLQLNKVHAFDLEGSYAALGGETFGRRYSWPVASTENKFFVSLSRNLRREQIAEVLARHGLPIDGSFSANDVLTSAQNGQEAAAKIAALAAEADVLEIHVPQALMRLIPRPPEDPRLAKLEADSNAPAGLGDEPLKQFSFFIHPHQQSLENAVRHFAEPLIREFGLQSRGNRALGTTGIKVDVQASTAEEAVSSIVWLAGHSRVKKVQLHPTILTRVRQEIARQGIPRRARSALDFDLSPTDVPNLFDHQWEKIHPAAENGDLDPSPSRYLWFTFRPAEGQQALPAAEALAAEAGLDIRSSYTNGEGHLRVRAEAWTATRAARAALKLAGRDEVLQINIHPATWGLVPTPRTPAPAANSASAAAAPVDGSALGPNDARISKLQELPHPFRNQANNVFWLDMRARPGNSNSAAERLPDFVRTALDRLGIALDDGWLELFNEHGEPAMLRVNGHAPSAELAALAAVEFARFGAVTGVFLHEEALALAQDRPHTLGRSDPRLLKIHSASGPILDRQPSKLLWFDFILHPEGGLIDGGALHGDIMPMLERMGLEYKVHQWHGQNYRVQAEARTLREAIDRALELAADSRVTEIDLHPATWQLLQSRVVRNWDQELSAGERAHRMLKIGLLPESLQVGPVDVLLADIAQQLPGRRGTENLIQKFITPAFAGLGLTFSEGELLPGDPRAYRARARAGNAEAAALAALDLVGKDGVFQALIHPAAEELLRQRLFGSAQGGPKSQAAALGPKGGSTPSGGSPGGGGPTRAASQARDTLRKFLYALLAQGLEKRSPGTLNAAADALAAVSNSSDDLEKARMDWIRFERMSDKYPQAEAAAMIIAKHGGGAEDLARLLRATTYIDGTSGHYYNPPKRRIATSLAKLYAAKYKPSEFAQKLKEDKEKPLKTWNAQLGDDDHDRYKNDTRLNALYIAAAKNADASARHYLESNWSNDKTPLLYRYLSRIDSEYVRGLYDKWRQSPEMTGLSVREQLLTAYAVSEFGTADDLEAFLTMMEKTGEYGNLQAVSDAFASFVKRVGVLDRIRKKMHDWLHALNSSNLGRAFIAMTVLGEAGTTEDLPMVERWVNANPDQVQNTPFHEMTHHEAAISWAKLVVKLGLIDRYLTEIQPAPVGKRSATKIVMMLTDTNPMANKAALAAIQLHFGGEEDFGF